MTGHLIAEKVHDKIESGGYNVNIAWCMSSFSQRQRKQCKTVQTGFRIIKMDEISFVYEKLIWKD